MFIFAIGAAFLYLWCMVRAANSQLIKKFDEVNRRIDGHDETLKSIQSSLAELTSVVKALVITHDKEIKGSVPVKGSDYGEQFTESVLSKPLIMLRSLHQTTSVIEYNDQFNSFCDKVTVQPEMLLNLYVGGLTKEIRNKMLRLQPKSLSQAKSMALEEASLGSRLQEKSRLLNINILKPGMVLLKGYISVDDQVKIVKTCCELGIGDGGFYQPCYPNGTKSHFKMMCLGKNWDPQSREYSDTREIDNSKPPKIPDYFHDMVKRALQDSNTYIQKSKGKIIPSMSPNICIAKFYTKDGKLGLHQDKDESRESLERGLPVVSFSIGDSAEFLYGKERDIEKTEKVHLKSGDVLIFGGESRHIFHGVSCIVSDTAPKSLLKATYIRDGRLNLFFKQY